MTATDEKTSPPEERFWTRYSPHGEAPISAAGSLALHALAFGLLLFVGIYLAARFAAATPSMPLDAVQLDPGGGGEKQPPGAAARREDVPDEKEKAPAVDDAPRPALTPVEIEKVKRDFDADAFRFLSERKSRTAQEIARMDDAIRKRLPIGDPGDKGGGGPGPGSGGPQQKLDPRVKRALRWHLQFTVNDGPEYLRQLRGLGAILAFPVGEGAAASLKVVRKLEPGGPAVDEDISQLGRIFWIDDREKNVRDILAALNLKLPEQPTRFVALMPEKLEAELYRQEREYVERRLRRPWREDQVADTYFEVVNVGGVYRPRVVKVEMR